MFTRNLAPVEEIPNVLVTTKFNSAIALSTGENQKCMLRTVV